MNLFLAKPNFEGAKYVCSPARKQEHLDAMWDVIANRYLLSVGSDHAAVAGGFEKRRMESITCQDSQWLSQYAGPFGNALDAGR